MVYFKHKQRKKIKTYQINCNIISLIEISSLHIHRSILYNISYDIKN